MFPIEISFIDFQRSDAVYNNIMKRAERLERFYDRIQSCRVAVSYPHRHSQKGKIFHVNIQLYVPGKVLVVSHEPEIDKSHEDIYVNIRDAFDSMEREIEHHVHKKMEKYPVRDHGQPVGIIQNIFYYEGYGFITSADGVDHYFHRNSVLSNGAEDGFEELEKGDLVRFNPERGIKGPQASSLTLIEKGVAPSGEVPIGKLDARPQRIRGIHE